MSFDQTKIDGLTFNTPRHSRQTDVLHDLAEGVPVTRERIQEMIAYMSGVKFEADPYVNVNDLLPVLKEIRLALAKRAPL